MRELPKAGQIYRHFKGNIYRIVTIAEHSETGEMLVIYKRDDSQDLTYARPLDMFLSEVDKKKYPDVRDKYRFTLCSDEILADIANGDIKAPTDSAIAPLLESFLDASSISDKIDIFYDMKKVADEEMLGYVAASLDLDVSGDVEEKYSEILRALKAREKYESNRLRR